jgi:Fusaric acid resistance protein-like
MIRRLLEIDHDKLDLRLAGYALVGILVATALEAIVGVGALQTGVAAVVVVVVGRTGDLRTRMVHMGAVTLIGGAFGFLSYISAETAWQAALVLGVVSYLTGLAYGLGPAVGGAGYLLLLWSMAVLIGEAHGGDPPATAAAFLVGGVAAMVVIGVATAARTRWGKAQPTSDDNAPARRPRDERPSIGALVRSDLGVWSLLRAVLTVVAVVIGYWLTSEDLDPFWTAIALLVVMQPDLDKTLFKAAQRGLGTLVGVATATAVIDVVSSGPPIVVIVLIVTFGAVAFYTANYMIYAFFLTNAVLLYYWLAVDHQVSGPAQRLTATLIGIALALGGMALVALRGRRSPTTATRNPNHG